jgi:hypothetical protein
MSFFKKSVTARAAGVWEDRWVRFRMALKVRVVEAGRHDYYRGWILKWLGLIKPKSFRQGTEDDCKRPVEHLWLKPHRRHRFFSDAYERRNPDT